MSHLEVIRYRPHSLTRRERFWGALRSITLGPWNPKDPAIARAFGSGRVSSGVAVDERTAMNYSAVWAAVNLIASDVASVPLKLFKRESRGKSPFEAHALYRLVHDRPNPEMSSFVFRRTLQAHKLVWGNGYAEIERDLAGRPIALWPLMPWSVEPHYEGGRLRYRVYNPDGRPIPFEASDILHIRGLGDDGTCGLSVITKARESLGLGIAAERFGATFFGNGSTFGAIITYPPGVGKDTQVRKENRDAIASTHQGVANAHRLLALYEGAKVESLGVPPNDAQFLETREFQIEEVCRWFNVQPHKLKHLKRSTNNNIEQQSIEYVTDTLDPHWVDWEQELNIKLVAPLERGIQFFEHVREGRLKGDSVARGELQSKQFSIAAITPNEIRAQENRNEVEGGNRAFVAMNLIPLDRVDEWFDAQIKAKETPPPVPPPVDKTKDEEIKALREAVEATTRKAQEWEDKHDLAQAAYAAEHQAYESVRVALVEKCASSDATLVELEQTRKTLAAEFEIRREASALVVVLTAERDDFSAKYAVAEAARVDAEVRYINYRSQQDTVVDTYRAGIAKAEADRDAALALALQAEQERDEAKRQAVVAQEETQSLQVETREILAGWDTAKSNLQLVTSERDAVTGEVETLKTDVARARADIATELERARTHKVTMLAAMRSLFVDASERLLQKEADRARKHQATPDKLRTWIETFYPLQAQSVRTVFQPLVGPWTALTGGAPGLLLDRLVAEHVEASTTALRLVADVDEPDEMAGALERTLGRWDAERADTMADALVREGMAS